MKNIIRKDILRVGQLVCQENLMRNKGIIKFISEYEYRFIVYKKITIGMCTIFLFCNHHLLRLHQNTFLHIL
jgi:hypothetical protein